jgi:hypothetical protein
MRRGQIAFGRTGIHDSLTKETNHPFTGAFAPSGGRLRDGAKQVFRIVRKSIIQLVLLLLLAAALAGAALTWLLPATLAERWALDRAGPDPFAQFEAAGQAQAVWQLGRWTLPLLAVLLGAGLARARWCDDTLRALGRELLDVTAFPTAPTRWRGSLQRFAARALLLLWGLLAVQHAVGALFDRTREWPYYRLRSGAEVLPNISDSNRDVIRYLRQAVPENARILPLVLSAPPAHPASHAPQRRVRHPAGASAAATGRVSTVRFRAGRTEEMEAGFHSGIL